MSGGPDFYECPSCKRREPPNSFEALRYPDAMKCPGVPGHPCANPMSKYWPVRESDDDAMLAQRAEKGDSDE